jgi:uncharacterized membrane protein
LLFLAGGERYHRRQLKIFARGLTGGGAAILYLSLYFAFQVYQIISQPLAFFLMALVTAAAVALSWRYNSRTILLFAMFGGFFTPFWVSTGQARPVALFTYIAILDLGLVAVAWRKDWKFVNSLCFLATAALYAGWYADDYDASQFWLAEIFLTIFYLIFAALAFLLHLVRKRQAQIFDALSIAGNALFYFLGNLALLESIGAEKYRGLFTAGMAIWYGMFSLIALRRQPEDKLITLLLLGVAVTFLTVFFPIEINEDWVPLAWLVETYLLVNIGARLQLVSLQRLGLVVGIFAWLALCGYIFDHQGRATGTGEIVTFLLGTIGALATVALQAPPREQLPSENARWLVLWEMLALLTLPFLLATYETSAALLAIATILLALTYIPSTTGPLSRSLAFYFVPVATLIIFLREYKPDWMALQNFVPVLNARFLLYFAAALALGGYLFIQKNWPRTESTSTLDSGLLQFARLQSLALPFFALTLEVLNFYDFRAEASGFATSYHAPKHLTLSAVWSVFSLLLLMSGIWKRLMDLRLAALLIFALTIVKVAFIDFWLFEKIYRIISALVFGGILVYASYLYQRHKDKIIAAVIGKEESEPPRGSANG